MHYKKLIIFGALLIVLIFSSSLVKAIEKPKTMEDMWKIIEAQQKQIDALQASGTKNNENTTPVNTTQKPDNKEATSIAKNPENKVEVSAVKSLERKTNILSEEVEKLRTNLAIPEEAQLKGAYGLGPAASKIYQVGKGLSIGGYGEAFYKDILGEQSGKMNSNGTLKTPSTADLQRMVLYVGYKFSDRLLFNSEIEFEHGTTGSGSDSKGEVSVEFASLDFFIDPLANIRTGLMLMPMGLVNRIHEPLFFFGNNRPVVETTIIPSTWREMGVGAFGSITPELSYTAYVVNGLDAEYFGSAGIRKGRGSGTRALANDLGYVAQLNYDPDALPGVNIGTSAYVGNSGQDQSYAGQKVNAFTQLYESHLQWKYRGLEFRALGSMGFINDSAALSANNKLLGNTYGKGPVGSENYGWYSELGYDVLPLIFNDTTQYLAPFFRYEKLNTMADVAEGYTADPLTDQRIFQVGLQYKPMSQVVIKADYRNFSTPSGAVLPDDFNLGFGFIF